MEPELVRPSEAFVFGLRLSDSAATAQHYTLMYCDEPSWPRVITDGSRIVWASSEARIRAWAAEHLVGTAVDADSPAPVGDVLRLLELCERPDDWEEETDEPLSALDMLDDVRATVDDMVPTGRVRSGVVRKVHDVVRDEMIEGHSWSEALELAGGADAVADGVLLILGRITMASAFRSV